jgi:hypothetical protein
MSKKESNLVVVVGCGGVLYHGLPGLANFLSTTPNPKVWFFDGDVVEEKNIQRQWTEVGVEKAYLASAFINLQTTLRGENICATNQHFTKDNMMPVLEVALGYTSVWVVALPDNFQARILAHDFAVLVAKTSNAIVYCMTAGNTPENGYAYVSRMVRMKRKGVKKNSAADTSIQVVGDWTTMHPEIVEGAFEEASGIQQPMACGDMGTVEQTVLSNTLTATCLWECARIARDLMYTGEVLWSMDEEGDINMFKRERSTVHEYGNKKS